MFSDGYRSWTGTKGVKIIFYGGWGDVKVDEMVKILCTLVKNVYLKLDGGLNYLRPPPPIISMPLLEMLFAYR